MTREVIFVGVGGCSSSGKTTLSRGLVHMLGEEATVEPAINLDWYLDPTRMPLIGSSTKERNWETPDGVCFDLILEELDRLKDFLENELEATGGLYTLKAVRPKEVQLRIRTCQENSESNNEKERIYVVVEGYLVFWHKALADLMRHRFWIETPYETALQRRLNRDMPTQLHRADERLAFGRWFEGHIWKHYQHYRETQLENAQPACVLQADWRVQDQLKRVQQYIYPNRKDQQPQPLTEASSILERDIQENSVPDLKSSEDTKPWI